MENWRDFVGHQKTAVAIRPIGKARPNRVRITFFKTSVDVDGEKRTTALSVEKLDVPLDEVNLTDEEVGVEVERLLHTFAHRSSSDPIDIERAKFGVAKRSMRGSAMTNFGKVWFYRGTSAPDAPIIVAEYQGKFAIFQHPNFDDYGFIVED